LAPNSSLKATKTASRLRSSGGYNSKQERSLEFGVGDGTENNTLVLLSIGWRGAWVGGENLAFDPDVQSETSVLQKGVGFTRQHQ
jgi:hypothetical protein